MDTPHLTNLNQFNSALEGYRMSEDSQHILDETPFVLMLAATASGRNTIINQLIKTGHYHFIVSDTTRPPRTNNGVKEQNGVEYFFRTEEEMLADIKSGLLVEAEVIHGQQVSGVSIREFKKAHNMGKIAITDIDLGGSQSIADLKKDVKMIFIAPPSFDEWLRRIAERNSPTPQEVRRRLTTAVNIFQAVLADRRYICVVNDDLQRAVTTVDAIAMGQPVPGDVQSRAREVTQSLLEETQKYLAKN